MNVILVSFVFFKLRTDFTHCSAVSIVDFEQVNVGWECTQPALTCLKSTIETPEQA